VTICPNNSATLTATAPGGTYEWYDAATGGNLLFTGATYVTPVLATTTNYWVQTTVNGCTSPRTMVTVTIAAAITVNAGVDDTICAGQSYNLSVTPNGAGYSYVWDEPANLGFSTIFNPTVTPAATTTYTVTVTDANNCTGTDNVTIYVNPVPTVTPPANATYCDGDAVPASTFASTPAGATFTWTNSDPTIGLAASGTGNTPAFTATNATGAPVTATITVTPTLAGCVGAPVTYTITVNNVPTVSVPANATYCDGDPVPASAYTSVPAGATFDWTNSDPSIGLAATGTGNTPAFTATNATGAPITATITVTPTVSGCAGTASTYTITVNPTPTMTAPANATYCNGDAVPAGVFSSTPAGGTFTWTNSDPSIGLAASGTGNTPAFTATNGGGAAVTATITVTPTVNGCAGTPSTYTITVNPGATANVTGNISACPGDLVPASNFTSTPAGGTFTWTNSNPTIGLAASGTGNTPAFTATNPGAGPITATISVIATASGCPGVASTYTITINPITTGTTNASICQGDSILLGGVYVSTAGTYTDTLTSSFGCDSILTTNVTVNIVSVATTPVVVCDGDSVLIEGSYYSTAGQYPFTFTSAAGCDSIVIYDITIAPLPVFNITPPGPHFINLGESVDLVVMPGIPGGSYSWDPPFDLTCSSCQDPTATPAESVWYFVTVTDANGCSAMDSVYIEVDPSTNIYVPNIFSPNGTEGNNVYYVRGKGIEQFDLKIYNRWGQLVFESDDINKGWDGTKDGTDLNQGVFVYQLQVRYYDGESYQQTGNITLIR
jgi:gliding motility-associated-like protein